jgi:ribosome-binding protein aMBF1 (putative translation factor)
VVGANGDLASALRALSDGRVPVVESAPVGRPTVAPEDAADPVTESAVGPVVDPVVDGAPVQGEPGSAGLRLSGLVGRARRLARERVDDQDDADDLDVLDVPADSPGDEQTPPATPVRAETRPTVTPPPARETVAASRAEVRREVRAELADEAGEQTQAWDALLVRPESGDELIPEDEEPVAPVIDPVIGPQVTAARERLGLSVDELADRTRIRPHVIEAIEVDDFGACGGDFYARGHLRTLARVLGVDVTPLLAVYDECYADAPIDPRRVFEAELAGAGSIRDTRGGPNWSVLVAAVMALVLCWSVARLVTGGPGHDPDEAVLSGSGGPNHSRHAVLTAPVPVVLTATGGGAHVVVRDGLGKLVFAGDLSYGQKRTLHASTPVRIQSTDGSLRVTVDGDDRGRMGPTGRPASRSYVGRG